MERKTSGKARASDAAQAVDEGLEIQRGIDAKEQRKKSSKSKQQAPPRTGQRDYPSEFPEQQLDKPGMEKDLELKPMFEAPAYKGSGKLEGMAAIVTGGDSGIGRAVAVLFAREGADVAILHLDEQDDADETKRVVESEGRRAITIAGDVASSEFCTRAVEQVLEEFGRLDVLVNNAAFQEHASDIADITDAHFERTLRTNLFGYFYMARACVPHMKPGASIIMTGSVTGLLGNKQLLDYSMTKGGIHAFARSLGSNLVEKGIRVNVVAPGPVWTPLNPADRPAEKVKSFGADTPMKRAAQPEEIAPAYVFFAAPTCASYITGEILPIIGGYSGG